jgi:hypothetical protein
MIGQNPLKPLFWTIMSKFQYCCSAMPHLSSPNLAPMASELLFQGAAWLLLEPKTTFYSPRYSPEPLSVHRRSLPFWSSPQMVLQLGHVEYLVLESRPADAAKRSGDAKESKKLLQLTVRPMDDVKRAQLYQTAARAQTLELFVDVEHTRERLLRCLRGEREPQQTIDPGKKLLDEAFEALEAAQQSKDTKAALELYKQAERGFWQVEQVLADDRSRELLKARRTDLQRTIRKLEKSEGEVAALPAAPHVEGLARREEGATGLQVEEKTMDISARLEELRRFAAGHDQAKEGRTDLTARLAALKNEKQGPAPHVNDLAERLRRLKGDAESAPAVGEVALQGKSAAERIIEQVTDEVALGIEDEELAMSEELEGSDSDDSSSPRSDSSRSSNEGSSSKKK